MYPNAVSVIVATKDEAGNIKRLIESLRKQTLPCEIIVVDNYSTDETLKLARSLGATVFIRGPERSGQRNFGAKKAKCKYFLFLDADMELPPKILARCVEQMAQDNAAAVIIPEDVTPASFFLRIKRLDKRLYWEVPFLEAARFFSRSAFFKVDGYDEALVAGEDWDLSQRVGQIGKIARIRTPLYHNEPSILDELKSKWYYARLVQRYAKKHPDEFRAQSGLARLRIFRQKKALLFSDLPAAIGLITLKAVELALYYAAVAVTRSR